MKSYGSSAMSLDEIFFEDRNKDFIEVCYRFDNSLKRRIIHRFSFLLDGDSNVNLADVIRWLQPNYRNAKLM